MVIGGFSKQIKEHLDRDKDLKKMDMILEEVGRLERLVAELGDLTKGYNLVMRNTDINALIRDVVQSMADAYPAHKYRFRKTLTPDMEEIPCDPDKLKQVFINIITNSLQAMNDGGSLSISTEQSSGHIEIRISDEGIGIPEENLQQIFEPFFTTRNNGSGLGLSISYKIIEAHKGDISVSSRPSKGTSFIIQLPTA
jgi:signal transduction histidine kinase